MKSKRGIILIGVIVAMLLSALDQTIVTTALPTIVRDFNGLSHITWVVTSYMLASTVTVPIYGKLSDIFGRKWLFILGIAVFLFGSILSGLSQNMTQLILFRGLQGIGAGAMMVNSLAIIGDLYSPQERGKFQGLMGGVFGVATIIGPLLGGWLTEYYSWRWVFYVNIPVGVIAIAILTTVMPKIVHEVKNRAIDFAGALLISAGLVPLLLAFVWAGSQYAWGSWQIVTLLAVAAAALFAFALVERRVREPVLALNLFQNRVFSVSAIVTFLTAVGMFGALIFITVFAQGVVGMSPTNSGLVLIPMMGGMIFSSVISGLVISRLGKYKIMTVIGVAVCVLGMFLFSGLSDTTSQSDLILRMIVLGLGLGVTMPVFTIAVQNAFNLNRLGEVTAGVTLFRSLGGTVGAAVFGGIMNSQLTSRLASLVHDPAVAALGKLNPALASINSNTIQVVLNPATQAPLRAAGFGNFLDTLKTAFSSSLDQVFLIATILMGVAFVVVIFLPEIPLRKVQQSAVVEAGMELDAELGMAEAKDEPKL